MGGFTNEYRSSLPRPPLRFDEKNPLSSSGLKTIPKSSPGELMGACRFTGLVHSPFENVVRKISRPPRPGCPFEEKYRVVSFRINGNISSEGVLITAPAFTARPKLSFGDLRVDIQISFPPCPLGRLLVNTRVSSSGLMEGLPKTVVLSPPRSRALGSPQLRPARLDTIILQPCSVPLSFEQRVKYIWLNLLFTAGLPSLASVLIMPPVSSCTGVDHWPFGSSFETNRSLKFCPVQLSISLPVAASRVDVNMMVL